MIGLPYNGHPSDDIQTLVKLLIPIQEIDGKYRGGKGWAIRLPFTRLAIVVGKWTATFSESMALTRAINGRAIEEDSFDWDTVRYGAEDEDI